MAADRNKTELTLRTTEWAVDWLAGIGCKCVETEVPIAAKWVADAAGVWCPTRTEAQKQRLIGWAPKYRSGSGWPEHNARCAAWNETYNALPRFITVALEVKTSVADFRQDDKWNRESPADMRVLAIPTGMLPKDQWPQGWWVLLTYETGYRIAQRAPLVPVDDTTRLRLTAAIAERRHNRTNYVFSKEMQQSHRDQENARINRIRMDRAVEVVLNYIEGKVEMLDNLWVPGGQLHSFKVPNGLKERLESAKARAAAIREPEKVA